MKNIYMEVQLNVMAIRSNFKSLRARLEEQEGRRVSYKEIVGEINEKAQTKGEKMSEPTLIRFANNKVNSVSYSTLESLVNYFSTKGIKCEPGDLLILDSDGHAA